MSPGNITRTGLAPRRVAHAPRNCLSLHPGKCPTHHRPRQACLPADCALSNRVGARWRDPGDGRGCAGICPFRVSSSEQIVQTRRGAASPARSAGASCSYARCAACARPSANRAVVTGLPRREVPAARRRAMQVAVCRVCAKPGEGSRRAKRVRGLLHLRARARSASGGGPAARAAERG